MKGVMLDCSRNAVMNVKTVKKFITYLKKTGYDALMLYTEDTYEIKEEPLFGYMRGRYSQEELKEIVSFGDFSGVEVIPCIQTLAHLNAIFNYPRFLKIRDVNDILLVDEEETYKLIEEMFVACENCFSSRRIHIGMDEAHMLGLGKYLDAHGYKNREEIFLRHLNRVCDIAEKHGFKPMIWSDMFFRLGFNGEYYKKDGHIPKEVRNKVPKGVQLVYWDYYNSDKETYDGMIKAHKEFDNDVVFAGGAWKWTGFNALQNKSIETTRVALKSCKEHGINDVFITMWGDNGNECPAFAVLPALVYAIECLNGNFDIENAKTRFNEIFGENWDDFMLFGFPAGEYFDKDDADRISNASKTFLFNDCFLGRFDCSLTGTGKEAKAYADLAKKFAAAAKRSENFSYLFEYYQKLCDVLSYKCDLGYLTRKAYQDGDRERLKNLVLKYEKTIVLTEEFLNAFRTAWQKDNKPHGFDVQEIRVGGLLQRLKSCKDRLTLYLDGKVDEIEELNEKLVDFVTGKKPEGKLRVSYSYCRMATPNPL